MVREEERITEAPDFKKAVESMGLELTNVGQKPRRGAARRLLVLICISIVLTVLDERFRTYTRAYAWYRRLLWWGTMRSSDSSSMPPRRMSLGRRGLRAVFGRD